MAVRPKEPRQGTTAVATAGLVVAVWLAAPVLAAPDRDLLCDESTTPELDVPVNEFTATPVSSSDELVEHHLLRPNTESAARNAFSKEAPEAVEGDEDGEDDAESLPAKSLLPSASDRQQSPYKRQMYRRDI